MPHPADLLVRGAMVVAMNTERRVYRRGFLAIKDGRLLAVGDDSACDFTSETVIDATDRVIIPGFVNAHTHLIAGFSRGLGGAQFVNVGGSIHDLPSARLRSWMDEEACYHSARLALIELQKSGVTTTTDSQPGLAGEERRADGTLRAIRESKARALYTRASLNRTEFIAPHHWDSIDRAIPELERLSAAWSSDRVEIGAEAQALHRVEEDLLKALKDWTRRAGVHFAMHLSYSREAAAHALERFGTPLMTLLDDWGVLDEKFIGYHPVWVEDAEVAAIARSGAGVAYCPVDNMLIACGVVPVTRLLDAGARLGLGIDQPNDGHNFFELMKLGLLLQRVSSLDPTWGSPELMLEMGTLGGARAMHREDSVGSLEPGKHADFVVLDARRTTLNPIAGRLSNLVLAASPADVESVYIGGEPVVFMGQHMIWDEHEVIDAANQSMKSAAASAGFAEDFAPLTTWPVS